MYLLASSDHLMSSSPLPRALLWLNHICVENVIRLSIGVHDQLQVVLLLQGNSLDIKTDPLGETDQPSTSSPGHCSDSPPRLCRTRFARLKLTILLGLSLSLSLSLVYGFFLLSLYLIFISSISISSRSHLSHLCIAYHLSL